MGSPATYTLYCPRCLASRLFFNIDGASFTYRCGGCEWAFLLGTQSPTDTTNAAITAGSSTALSVASGGASFTSGMLILVDTGSGAEVVTSGTGTGTSIPVPGGFVKNHLSGVAIGQLLLSPAQSAVDADTPVSAWPTAQPATF
jgi:hypothetical protein